MTGVRPTRYHQTNHQFLPPILYSEIAVHATTRGDSTPLKQILDQRSRYVRAPVINSSVYRTLQQSSPPVVVNLLCSGCRHCYSNNETFNKHVRCSTTPLSPFLTTRKVAGFQFTNPPQTLPLPAISGFSRKRLPAPGISSYANITGSTSLEIGDTPTSNPS